MPQQPATEIGQYRPATRLKKGWQVRVLPADDADEPEWLTITQVLHVLAPIEFVRIDLSDGTAWQATPGSGAFCRTPTEIARAAKSTAPQEA
jgi:hypothetical protein